MDFLEDEAAESSGSDSDAEAEHGREKHAKKRAIIDSDEDEDDGEELDKDLEDLIDDNPIEDDGSGSSGSDGEGGEKRKHDDSDLEEDLSDEDYDLIKENLGIEVKRKKKLKRVRVMSDEDSDKEVEPEDERDRVAQEIFEGDDADEEIREKSPRPEVEEGEGRGEFGNLDDSGEESDPDDFIVDEDGQPISKTKRKRHIIHADKALQEAQDIFGVDFNFDEFEQYGDEYEEDDEDDDEEYEEDEEDEDGEPRRRQKKAVKRRPKKTIHDVFEPSELERLHFTDADAEIRTADIPERFQLRRMQVQPLEDGEVEEEAEWLFKQAFKTTPVSAQVYFLPRFMDGTVDDLVTGKIAEALKFMRNSLFEVPFIAFYRKEYVEPELSMPDLWQVFQWDEKWMQLRQRKQNMLRLFENMQTYQFDQIGLDESTLDASVRALTEEDLNRAKGVQTMEELRDVYQHFLLYYGSDIPKMKAHFKAKRRREAEERGEEYNEQDEDDEHETLKHAPRKTGYTMCQQAGLAELARKFGLTPEQFAENLRDNYTRHDVEQDPAEPQELAEEYIKGSFNTTEDVLKGASHMVAMQIAHEPLVRQTIREQLRERAKITSKPTKKGMKQIDESHPCFTFKFLKNKPVRDLKKDQFLYISRAQEDGLMTYDLTIDDFEAEKKDPNNRLPLYFEEIKNLYYRDEFSSLVEKWNHQRSAALERALKKILYPQLIKELKNKLLEESKEHVLRASCGKLQNWLKIMPYQPETQLDEDDQDLISNKVRIMGVAYPTDRDEVAFAAMIDGEGEVTDFLRLKHLMKRSKSYKEQEREEKAEDVQKIKEFISTRKPHVIAVSAQNRDASMVMDDLRNIVTELEQEHQMASISVELVDNELAVVYQNSNKAENDFRDYPPLLRHAISIARRLQDPLIEFSKLCNPDEDIMALKYHPLQDAVSKDDLLNAINLEFVNRVNEVGVDVNRCVNQPHTSSLIQFICGLGPRKGYNLLKILKQNNKLRLENRTQLVTDCHMGPKVFINCAGFIKIDTTALERESTEAYVEVLDGSRVHPETYEWARKMAVDALEYDDTAEDANPAGALEEILENPERLRDLDLDAFAEELERQGYGNKHITLYDIRAELNHRYKDLRQQYQSPGAEDTFNMLVKESPETFYAGKLVQCQVIGFRYKRPTPDELETAQPVRDEETSMWICPFCKKKNFPELSAVWEHFDENECNGQTVGVRCRLENGVSGYIPVKNISDSMVTSPEERVQERMMLHARVAKIFVERFSCDLTCKSSELMDKSGNWRSQEGPLKRDDYYDEETEEAEKKKEEEKKKQQARQTYVKRVIAHPSFHNVDYRTSEKLLASMEQGDVVIRPSSKGSDHLTASWKIADGVHHHIDVREEGKENAFSLGTSLWIGMEEFEDLDEIIARYIQPMAAFARDITNHKYYVESEGGKRDIMETVVTEEKRKAPSKIPYFFTASKQFPGKFMLSYLPRKSVRHEFVTVTPDGIRYRGNNFHSLNALIPWFKEHFRDPLPGTPNLRTPRGVGGTPRVTPQMVNRTPSGVFQVPPSQPYSSFQTPMMTPMMQAAGAAVRTPGGHMRTPGYQPLGATPAQPVNMTPQYIPTPKATWGGGTPSTTGSRTPGGRTPMSGRTPGQMGPPGSSRTPQSVSSHHRRDGTPRQGPSKSATDWAQAAQMWAKQRNTDDSPATSHRSTPSGRTPSGRTPSGRTPSNRTPGGRTPGRHTPGRYTPGDATPLFDEH